MRVVQNSRRDQLAEEPLCNAYELRKLQQDLRTPKKSRATDLDGQQVSHQSGDSPIPVREGMNIYQLMMKPYGYFLLRKRGVIYPEASMR